MPKVVGIDPVTGAPVMEEITPLTEPISIPAAGNTPGFEVKPNDAFTPAKPVDKPTGMENKIEEAKEFNEKLNKPVLVKSTEQKVPEASKLERIRQVLKAKGMDSQQQSQAMEMIASILSD